MSTVSIINHSTGLYKITCLSTEIKWTDSSIPVGSELKETDTGRKFIWDGTNWKGDNFPLGAQIGSDTNFVLTSVTSGNTVSATFTMPTGGTFDTISLSAYNPSTSDLTATLYAQETLGTATRSCNIGSLSFPKSDSTFKQITGAFLGTDLLVRISPDADCNTASGTAILKLRSVRGGV